VAGGLLLVYALGKRSWQSAVAAPLGGALVYYAATGRNPLVTLRTGGSLHDEGVTIHRAVTISRPPPEVYDFWRRLENLPRFMSHLDSVTDLGEGRSRWEARTPGGVPLQWEARITADEPGRRLAWETLPGANLRHHGDVTFRPAPAGAGTELHVEMTYAPPGGAIASAVAELLNGITSQQVKEQLRACKQILEAGETPTIDGQPAGRKEP
jgi:uncharacterized membrane protein